MSKLSFESSDFFTFQIVCEIVSGNLTLENDSFKIKIIFSSFGLMSLNPERIVWVETRASSVRGFTLLKITKLVNLVKIRIT